MQSRTVWIIVALWIAGAMAILSCSGSMRSMGSKKFYLDPSTAAKKNMEELKPLLGLSEEQEKDLYDLHRRYYKRTLSDLDDYEDKDIDGHELESRARVLGFKTVQKAQKMLSPDQSAKYRQWAQREGIIK